MMARWRALSKYSGTVGNKPFAIAAGEVREIDATTAALVLRDSPVLELVAPDTPTGAATTMNGADAATVRTPTVSRTYLITRPYRASYQIELGKVLTFHWHPVGQPPDVALSDAITREVGQTVELSDDVARHIHADSAGVIDPEPPPAPEPEED